MATETATQTSCYQKRPFILKGLAIKKTIHLTSVFTFKPLLMLYTLMYSDKAPPQPTPFFYWF